MEKQAILCKLETLKKITEEAIRQLGREEAKKIPLWKFLKIYKAN